MFDNKSTMLRNADAQVSLSFFKHLKLLFCLHEH